MRYSASSIEPVCYPEEFEGIILSFADRHVFTRDLYEQVKGVWDQHKADLRVVKEAKKTAKKHAAGKFKDELIRTAKAIGTPGKGILAADESTGTIGKRFDEIGVSNTENNRRAYRELLFTTPGLSKHISGVIMFDETARSSIASTP